jgi:hypothetical protein
MGKASEEGQGPPGAIEPMMMMINFTNFANAPKNQKVLYCIFSCKLLPVFFTVSPCILIH